MKKIVFATICFFGGQALLLAQETVTTTTTTTTTTTMADENNPKTSFYVGFGAAVFEDHKISDNLAAAGMPGIDEVLPEMTFGFNVMGEDYLVDIEFNTNYLDKKTSTDRIRAVAAGIKMRGHYIPVNTGNFYLSAGADLSYIGSNYDLFTRGNVIDLNDLNPGTHTGHISLYNNQFYAGPSLAFGAFQKSSFPLRLNVGYEWALISGKWKSEYANVNNTFRESGQGRFYAKLTFLL
ncbi:hypothetical protein DVK85_04170 [Flavobacterium arcticum]|uniref:Outer membrane protein beta-barrel domain-containing protein n=1 Tax=Flavobacterium arcticum TaxID=1784713 RepID=A0A345HA58_9FLAO|nr:hypothetical protein [Flavobacterium arcticum]AXG73468.1 hypothetical protein DVK85_04170 [Flavobacterium arcticum]KAF2513257.1 hypothetical protein E0W72_02220 [Flavobacterium arcticum]